MTIKIKRFVAVWVACALLLCGVCAGAEDQAAAQAVESNGWRLSNDMNVNLPLFHALLERLCPSRILQRKIERTSVLVNAIDPSLTFSGDGVQLEIDLNGKEALSIGGKRTDDGIAIASSLFPNYVISVYTGKLMQIVSDIRPMARRPKPGAKDAPSEAAPPALTAAKEAGADGVEAATDGVEAGADGVEAAADDVEAAADSVEAATDGVEAAADDVEAAAFEAQLADPDADEALPVDEMSQYVSITKPEATVYQVNGASFDVKRTYGLDCDGLVGVWNTFVDWIFSNKGIASLLAIAKDAELEIDADRVKSVIPSDSLPRFSATIYSNSATADRYITAIASSNDGTNVFGEAQLQIAEYDVTGNIRIPSPGLDIDFEMHRQEGLQAELNMRGKDPLLHATFNADEDAAHGYIEMPSLNSDVRFELTQGDKGPKGQLKINAAGNYLGSDFEILPYDASGDGLRFTIDLYYTDSSKPLFREEFVLQPQGDLTLDFSDAKKTVVPITSLIKMNDGYLMGFALDVLFNGMGGLLDAVSNVIAEMEKPII